ncbi:MAG: pilus assembly PilX family protein, partial [Burkholderiales bacterium]
SMIRHDISQRQQGAVLVTSLIVLVVMTLFVTSMLKTSVLEMKIGGANRWASTNFANAERALAVFLNNNNGKYAPGATLNVTTPAVDDGDVDLTAEEITCVVGGGSTLGSGTMMGPQALDAVYFDVAAEATYLFSSRVTLHQGISTIAPPGACTV